MKLNDVIQWMGTVFVLTMYVIMSWFPDLHPLNVVAGLCGAIVFFVWTVRVRNWPQMIINVVAALVCVVGLIRHFG